MQRVGLLALVAASAFSLNAQIATTVNRARDGMDELRIQNNSATSLVAFVVTVKQAPRSPYSPDPPFVVFSDPLIEPAAKPLLAGEERVLMRRGAPPSRGPSVGRLLEEPIVAAGIFADGVTSGDAALLTRLVLRRSNMLLATETALEILLDAGRHNIPRNQMIRQFRTMADSLNRWYLPPEQQAGRGVYQSIVGKLMNLPEVRAGAPFPPADFVAEETATLNQQRVRLLGSQPRLSDAAFLGAR